MANNNKITVFTAIDGWRDRLLSQPDGNFLAYTSAFQECSPWEIRQLDCLFKDPVRNAKMIKVLNHFYCETEYSLWIDANCQLLKSPEEFIPLLGDNDIMFAKHKQDDCIYNEAEVVLHSRKIDQKTVERQMSRYKKEIPNHSGMFAGGVILRRNNARVRDFNSLWWAEITYGTARDQLSLPFTLKNSGVKFGTFDWSIDDRNDYFKFQDHL